MRSLVLAGMVLMASLFQEPRVLQRVEPAYPPLALAARVQAAVRVSVKVAPDGSVQDVSIMEGHQLLNTAAIEAVRQWKFTTSPSGGSTNVTLQFQLPPPRPPS